jgi:hypothetical protein
MRALEQKITDTGEASLASASLVDMQQVQIFLLFILVIVHIELLHVNY